MYIFFKKKIHGDPSLEQSQRDDGSNEGNKVTIYVFLLFCVCKGGGGGIENYPSIIPVTRVLT